MNEFIIFVKEKSLPYH